MDEEKQMFDEYVELLPEDKREAFKTEVETVSKRVNLDEYLGSEENLTALLSKEFFTKRLQSESDRKSSEFEKNFMSSKLPDLLTAERKKGEKTPIEIEVEELKRTLADKDRESTREKQINRALAKAQESNIPAKLVERFIGETDEGTDLQINDLVKTLSEWQETAVQDALKEIGVQGTPKGIKKEEPGDLYAQYLKAIEDGNADLALALQGKLSRTKRK